MCDSEYDDPVVEEIREIRRRLSARFDHDPDRLFEHYVEYSKQFEDRLITKDNDPRRAQGKSAA